MKRWHFHKGDFSLQDVLNGNILLKEGVRKHYKLIGLIICMVLLSIYEDYQAQKRQAQLVSIEKQLKDAHYEYLSINAELSEMTRQSAIAKRLNEAGSSVKESNIPAIRIE